MSDDNKKVVTPEEVTAKVIEEFSFDPETQGEQIEKLTNERIENQKNLSKTIEQKAKYREQGVKAGILDPETFEPIEKKPEGETEINKPNTENLTREEAIFYAKGGTDEKLAIAKKIANAEGISILVAMEDDYYKSKVASMDEEALIKSNQIGASKGTPSSTGNQEKPIGQMTREEHVEHMKKKIPTLNG